MSLDFTDGTTLMGEIGDQASVTVSANVSSLSGLGLIEAFIPATLSATAQFRLEQDSTNWDDLSDDGVCP